MQPYQAGDTLGWIILLVLIATLVRYGSMIYHHLVVLKHSVSRRWSNIDVLLKQRHDELPN